MSTMNTKRVQLFRTWGNDKQTLGGWVVTDPTAGIVFMARTLELADKNNANNVSCILPGKYICRHTESAHLKTKDGKPLKTYEIIGVPSRSGVRIHSANYFTQLRGCVSMGDSHKDINADGQLDAIHSGDTIAAFERLMNYEDFELEIINTVPHI